MAESEMHRISVLILTKNEEADLPGCLDSVSWSDDVHVLDSESTDATVAIARDRGAKVSVRPFDGYSSQRNFGLQSIAYVHSWVLILDADERIPGELVPVLDEFVSDAPDFVAAARIRRRDIWWGRWLRHAQISPFYQRLVRPRKVHYVREINEVLVVDGTTRDLDGFFDHFPFSKGLAHWVAKHNAYSTMEAELIALGGDFQASIWTAVFDRDFNVRRRHQKGIFYRLPARPLLKFFYMVIIRRAFLDGMPGIRYSILQGFYEYLIVLKTREILSRRPSKLRAL